MSPEHQRPAIDWWCYLHTQCPDSPVDIARQQKWGRSALTKVTAASTNDTSFDHDGAPAQYDTGIESTHTNDIGIRKATMREQLNPQPRPHAPARGDTRNVTAHNTPIKTRFMSLYPFFRNDNLGLEVLWITKQPHRQ
jgi:hypothetical protein